MKERAFHPPSSFIIDGFCVARGMGVLGHFNIGLQIRHVNVVEEVVSKKWVHKCGREVAKKGSEFETRFIAKNRVKWGMRTARSSWQCELLRNCKQQGASRWFFDRNVNHARVGGFYGNAGHRRLAPKSLTYRPPTLARNDYPTQ